MQKKHKLEQNLLVVKKLNWLLEEHPSDDEMLRWTYALMTTDNAAALFLSDPTVDEHRMGKVFDNLSLLSKNFGNVPIDEMKEFYYHATAINDLCKDIVNIADAEFDEQGSNQYRKWAEKYRQHVSGNNFHYAGIIGNQYPSEEIYKQHQYIVRLVHKYDSTSADNVLSFIKSVNKQSRDMVSSPQSIEIPDLTEEKIREKALSIPARQFRDIAGFGLDVEENMGRAMSQLGTYFIYNANSAVHTNECIEASLEDIQSASKELIIRDDPDGWWERNFTRVRIVEPKDMPMMRLIEKFSKLPDLVRMDSENFADDLEIADHAIKLCGAFYKVLEAHRVMLEEQKERLVHSEDLDLPTDIATASIPEVIDERIYSLRLSAQFMTHQAANFGSIAKVIASERNRLGRIASMSATVQIPAMNAIRQFNMYQLRRMDLLGKKVTKKVQEQLEMDDHIMPAQIENASPAQTRLALENVFGDITKDLQSFHLGLENDRQKQIIIGQKIKDDSVNVVSNALELNP